MDENKKFLIRNICFYYVEHFGHTSLKESIGDNL